MKWIAILLVAYVAGYGVLRAANAEVWDRDGRTYVLFPADMPLLYHLYRPLSYADQAVTGTGAHIGPHREVAS